MFVECGGDDFYGRVEEIYKLQYRGPKPPKVVVFKCRWIDPKHVNKDDTIGLVEVKRDSVFECEDVYIVAQQATQVYFLPYPYTKVACLQGLDVLYHVQPHGKLPEPNDQDYLPQREPGDEFFQKAGGDTSDFVVRYTDSPGTEVDNDGEGDEVDGDGDDDDEEQANVDSDVESDLDAALLVDPMMKNRAAVVLRAAASWAAAAAGRP